MFHNRVGLALLLLLLGAAGAEAQETVKRIKCAEHFDFNSGLTILKNLADDTRTFSIQIVRDGCFPREVPYYELGQGFIVRWETGVSSWRSYSLERYGRITERINGSLDPGRKARLYFDPRGAKARGTFDYVLTVE